MTDAKLIHTLIRCGLNDTEAAVLASVVDRGEATAGSIALRTGIKRATVYSAIELLEKRGLLLRSRASSINRFSAVRHHRIIEELQSFWDKKRESIRDATCLLSDILNEYSETHAQHVGGYEITTFESHRKVEQFFTTTLKAGYYQSVFDISTFCDKPWKKLMLEILATTSITRPPIREIIIATTDTDWYTREIKNPNHKVKIVSGLGLMSSDFTVTRDSVILNTYDAGAEISIQIRHPGYLQTMSRIFEGLWRGATEL